MTWGGTIPAMPNQHTGMRPYKLTVSDAEAIRSEAQHVRNVTAFINRGDLKQVSEFSSSGGSVMGVQANYPEIRNIPHRPGTFSERRTISRSEGESWCWGRRITSCSFPDGPRWEPSSQSTAPGSR